MNAENTSPSRGQSMHGFCVNSITQWEFPNGICTWHMQQQHCALRCVHTFTGEETTSQARKHGRCAWTQKMLSEIPTEIKTVKADSGNTEGENSTTGCNKGNWKETENLITGTKEHFCLLEGSLLSPCKWEALGLEMTSSTEHQSQGLSKGTALIKWQNSVPFLLSANAQ